MIAMAVLTKPKLLIADEPTTALDVSVQAQILSLLKELKQEMGMSLLFITHNLNIVRRLADNVAVMREGRVVERNTRQALFNSPQHAYTRQLLDAEPQGEPLPLQTGLQPLLEVKGLQVAFPIKRGLLRRTVSHHYALKDLSFALRPGESLGLVGNPVQGKAPPGWHCCAYCLPKVRFGLMVNRCIISRPNRCCLIVAEFRWCSRTLTQH